MKNLPVVIPSKEFDFVVVGPIGYMDGIIAKSSNISPDLIGTANLIFNHGDSDFYDIDIEPEKTFEFNFVWSDYIVFRDYESSKNDKHFEAREFKILLVWRENEVNKNENRRGSRKYRRIERDFDRKAQDIYNLAFDSKLNMHERDNALIWLMSTIILYGTPVKEKFKY